MPHANRPAMIRLVLLSIFLSGCNASQGPKYLPDGPWNQQVSNYEDSGHDFETTVNDLMQKFEVPVGMDLETLSDRHPISVNVPRGKVADVLNVIVAQRRGFKWAVINGVVNVGPRQNAKSIVDLRISHFRINRASFDQLHAAIVSLPEVKSWLGDNHLTERGARVVIGAVSPGQPFKPLVSLDLQDVTLREILNGIIKCSGYHAWSVSRDGDNNQYLSIGVN
jgi:hypothetical protein